MLIHTFAKVKTIMELGLALDICKSDKKYLSFLSEAYIFNHYTHKYQSSFV